MKKDTVVPFSPRPAHRPEERGQRAVDLKVAELAEIFRSMKTGEGLEEAAEWLVRAQIDPDAERPTPSELVYRVGDANDGVVFTTPVCARYVDRLFDALDSKTWGEFRRRLPAEEWKRMADLLEEIPGKDDPLDVADVPGYCDGDWPPWLQKEIFCVLPPPLVKKYAEARMTSINGVYFHIRQEDLPALLAELERRGIHAAHTPDLHFN